MSAGPHHGIACDAVISVAQAGCFKPRVATCTKAADMDTAFIDRRKRPFGATPHQAGLWLDDMKSLADVMV